MKFAVCNELFGSMPLEEAALVVGRHGFAGVEIAPFTVFGDFSPGAVRAGLRSARAALAAAGLEFAGFHWLFSKPDGLHITTPDRALREKSWGHLRRLIEAAGELGGGNLVLGSPKQREPVAGQSVEEAVAILTDELAAIAPFAAAHRSPILLEALSSDQTRVVNLLSESQSIVEKVNHPGVGGMFDFHNCADESSPWEALIERFFGLIGHVHLNDPRGNAPTPGDAAFAPAFSRLAGLGYDGWVSLEIFSVPGDPEATIAQTAAFLRNVAGRAPGG
ncbi:MAG: sugar phosphate isomerase/epimerase [Candidatus Accumulibacter sp.]|jgi:sugar phosphate isomerase/epimerase|nr:sugar phosphate isomerase/epimerase [Accumulibacter sp.]